jgi:hypothetical protein
VPDDFEAGLKLCAVFTDQFSNNSVSRGSRGCAKRDGFAEQIVPHEIVFASRKPVYSSGVSPSNPQ